MLWIFIIFKKQIWQWIHIDNRQKNYKPIFGNRVTYFSEIFFFKQISESFYSIIEQILNENRLKSTDAINQFITRRLSGSILTRQINNILSFTLPYSQKPNFEDFFVALERNRNSLDIASYGLSDTTLEEIFLLLTSRDENGELSTSLNGNPTPANPILNTLSNSMESDRDSGVAIELNSLDTTISECFLSNSKIVNLINKAYKFPDVLKSNHIAT